MNTTNTTNITNITNSSYPELYESSVDEIDINKLDDIANFTFKNIEDQLKPQTEFISEPKITLIDKEVFGW